MGSVHVSATVHSACVFKKSTVFALYQKKSESNFLLAVKCGDTQSVFFSFGQEN